MSIFRDRIVLPYFGGEPTAIYPEQIKAVALLKPGVSPVPMCRIVKKDSTAYTVTVSDIRTDHPTGMVDSQGKEYYAGDTFVTASGNTGVVFMGSDHQCMVRMDRPDGNGDLIEVPLYSVHANLTITGMVPWEA